MLSRIGQKSLNAIAAPARVTRAHENHKEAMPPERP
jgi:hypothetical protein